MLYYLYTTYVTDFNFLKIFKYLTFRTGGAIVTSLALSLMIGPRVIRWLKSVQKEGQPIRKDGPKSHLLTKKGTPTMGGILILISLTFSTLLWANLSIAYVWIVLLVGLGFGAIGFMDDFLKLKHANHKGISASFKFGAQTLFAFAAVWFILQTSADEAPTTLSFPFLKNLLVDLGWFYIPFACVVIVGASNAVNLTDGLDGLAIGPIIIASACFAVISYLVGHAVFAKYLYLSHIPGSGELCVMCGALVGAGLGFLWFNAPPAMVFMGDTGSLSVGGILGAISLITRHEIVLAIVGGLFVVETISVILQVGYFRLSGGKRIFLMAPLHHHFEKKGWSEPTVVIRFWIIALVLGLLGLATLKIR